VVGGYWVHGSNEKRSFEKDEEYAPIVQRIFQMSIDGAGAKDIAGKLNDEGLTTNRGRKWSKNHILYIMRNETYIGTIVFGKCSRDRARQNDLSHIVRAENSHPAIIESDEFQKVQKILESRSPKVCHPRTHSSDYVLSSLVFCGKCGLRMIGSPAKSSQFHYYACQNHVKRGKEACDAKSVPRDRLESFVIKRIKEHVLTEENLSKLV